MMDRGIYIYTKSEMLSAFISPNGLQILVNNDQIVPISTPEVDLKKILG